MGIIAVAQYTIKTISESITYDGSFDRGTEMWSQHNLDYVAPTSTVVKQDSTSEYGGKILEISNEKRIYARDFIPIQKNRVYKMTFRIKQKTNPSDASKKKCYAGACLFDMNKAIIPGTNQNGNIYFVANSIDTPSGWTTYTGYFGQSDTQKKNVYKIDANTKYFKPMFIVNYNAGNGVACVDSLTYEDVTDAWELEQDLSNKLDSDSQAVFDALTDNGRIQGIYMQNNQLYVNGQYINARNLRVTDKNGNITLGIDDSGNVTIQATTLKIGTKPVASKDDVTTSINEVQIGSRNLLKNTTNDSITTTFSGWDNYLQTLTLSEINVKAGEKLVGRMHLAPKSHDTGVHLDFRTDDDTGYSQYVGNRIQPGTEGYSTVMVTVPSTAGSGTGKGKPITKVKFSIRHSSGTTPSNEVRYREAKLERGTKATDWTPAPEDIEEGKLDVGGAINDVNNSNGQIQYPKLNISGMISFNDFDASVSKHYKIKRDANGKITETLINGGTIETGSVTADQMTMYNLSVVRRRKRPHDANKDKDCTISGSHTHWEDIDTSFNINEEGHIRASGTFSSFNFNPETRDTGWQIDENGDSVFNNTIVRGRVELPSAGMTDYGGKGRNNLLKNSNFRKDKESWSLSGGSTTIDKTNRLEEAYSAKIHRTGITTDSWYGFQQRFTTTAIAKGISYYISGYYFVQDKNTLNSDFAVEMKGRIKGATGESGLTTIGFTKTNCTEGKWTYFKRKVTTASEYEYLYLYQWVKRSGTVWFSKLKVEEVKTNEIDDATHWTPHKDETGESVRIWAGETYENRYDAAFKVLQNGTVIATRGEFGGTFTGRIEIGNIKIYDTNSSPGVIDIRNEDDETSIVRLGETDSYFNSPVYFGTPNNDSKQQPVSFKFVPSEKKFEVQNNSTIVVGAIGDKKLSLLNKSNNAYIKFGAQVKMDGDANNLNITAEDNGKVNVNIGDAKNTSANNDANLIVDGHTQTKTFSIGPVKMFATPSGDGIDFFVE